jgi:hypothetical protein
MNGSFFAMNDFYVKGAYPMLLFFISPAHWDMHAEIPCPAHLFSKQGIGDRLIRNLLDLRERACPDLRPV